MKRRDFTVIIASFSGVPARRFSVPRNMVYGFAAALLAVVTAFTLSSLHYYSMWNKTGDYASLQKERDELRTQNEAFRLTAKLLTDRLSSLEISAQKLRIVSGLDEAGLGGVGGPRRSKDPILTLSDRALYQHFRSLDRKSITLRNELGKLQDYYKDRNILLAATPSLMPVQGYPSDRYGMRRDPFTSQRDFHPGLDISAPKGNKVVATADGLVVFAGRQFAYGKLVILEHKFGISTRYGHLANIAVTPGQVVKRGDIVGYVGSTGRATGPHVHYEVRLNGRPLDPLRFFRDTE
ncbi:MAG: M23 family metallopeptidase [Acidobacteriota bacterium]